MGDQQDSQTMDGDLKARLTRLEARQEHARFWRRATLLSLAVLCSVPIVANALDPVPNIFSSGEVISASEINANFTYLQNAITAVEGQLPAGGDPLPTGTVAFFDLDACPSGWSEFTAARGRTIVATPADGTRGTSVGAPLANGGTRTISDVPQHGHALDGAGVLNSSFDGAHGHTGTANSVSGHAHSGTTNTDGSHTHSLDLEVASGYGTSYVMGTINSAGGNTSSSPVSSAGSHSHTFTTGTSGVHGHSLSLGQATTHRHTVDLSSLAVANAGSATVDVTMPYIQLLACRHD